MLLRMNQPEGAEAHLRRAVSLDADNPAFAMNLSEWCAATQRVEQAVAILQQITQRRPAFHWAWERLGELQFNIGNFSEARVNFQGAVRIKPSDPSLLLKLAYANIEAGELNDAWSTLENAARLQPDGHAYFRTIAAYYQRTSDWRALEASANDRIAAEPRDADAWLGLSRAQLELRRLRPSLASYRAAVDLGGATQTSFAALCMQVNAFDMAEEALQLAERQNPDDLGVLRLKSGLLMYKGAYEAAEACCERLLALNPQDGNGYRVLTQLKSGRLPDNRFQALLALSANTAVPDPDRLLACYGAADCLDARQDYDAAFQKYQDANAIARAAAIANDVRYDRRLHEMQIESLMSRSWNIPAPAPPPLPYKLAFIVGMPRSGTTLVESVLSAHSKVSAGGEYHAMRWIMDDVRGRFGGACWGAIDAGQLRAWRELYLEGFQHTVGALTVTDKHPFNFDAVGIIDRLFPEAEIIHVRRKPLETCLSIFRNHFESRHAFATDLEDIGHYYAQYARLMSHWEQALPNRITTIQYEDFVTQFEAACPALIDRCGLEWESECLEFDKSERLISTLSTIQARKPPRLSERAECYAALLKPLLDALAAHQVDLDSGRLATEHVRK